MGHPQINPNGSCFHSWQFTPDYKPLPPNWLSDDLMMAVKCLKCGAVVPYYRGVILTPDKFTKPFLG